MLKHLRRTDVVQGNANDIDEITRAKKLLNTNKRVKLDPPVKVKVESQTHHAAGVKKENSTAAIVAVTSAAIAREEEDKVKK